MVAVAIVFQRVVAAEAGGVDGRALGHHPAGRLIQVRAISGRKVFSSARRAVRAFKGEDRAEGNLDRFYAAVAQQAARSASGRITTRWSKPARCNASTSRTKKQFGAAMSRAAMTCRTFVTSSRSHAAPPRVKPAAARRPTVLTVVAAGQQDRSPGARMAAKLRTGARERACGILDPGAEAEIATPVSVDPGQRDILSRGGAILR